EKSGSRALDVHGTRAYTPTHAAYTPPVAGREKGSRHMAGRRQMIDEEVEVALLAGSNGDRSRSSSRGNAAAAGAHP
ncbi:unnamed protein product, partial [Urochloa humidicola]